MTLKRITSSFLPPITIDPKNKTPLYRQLYEWFRRAILNGQLRPGQRVPSTRNLAVELGISRIPVSSAYEQLHAEGYLETFVGAGTCVARSIPDDALKPATGKTGSASGQVAQGNALRRVSGRGALMRLPGANWAR